MPDGDVLTYDAGSPGVDVEDGSVLYVASRADGDRRDVPAKNGAVPDRCALAEGYSAGYFGIPGDEAGPRDIGPLALETMYHDSSVYLLYTTRYSIGA